MVGVHTDEEITQHKVKKILILITLVYFIKITSPLFYSNILYSVKNFLLSYKVKSFLSYSSPFRNRLSLRIIQFNPVIRRRQKNLLNFVLTNQWVCAIIPKSQYL